MNIFKLKIPKENVQEVNELESYSFEWYVKTGWSDSTRRQAKVFISRSEALEFKKQLEESAKFIGCFIRTEIQKN